MKAIDYIKNNELYEIQGSRYAYACFILGKLAQYALNKEKNASKENFEDMEFPLILEKLYEEQIELNREFFDILTVQEVKKDINFENSIEEMADVAGCCAGLIAKILKEIDK